MLRFLRWVPMGLGILVALLVLLLLAYYLPSSRKVHVVGTEVKRMDTEGQPAGSQQTRDVRYLYVQDADSGRSLAYRNEDTRWGFPFYFKFNSGDVAAEAMNIHETDPDATVLVTYYGWRLTFIDAYPNVLSLRVVAPEYRHVPVLKIFVLIMFLAAGTAGFLGYRRIRRRWKTWRSKRQQGS